MSEYQRTFYDRHYAERASALSDQLSHGLFADFYDRISDRVLELAVPGRVAGAGPDGAARPAPVRLLELGSGEGLLAAALHRVAARRHLELDYTGSDISAGALELARSAVPGEFVVGDAAEVAAGWAPASADVIVMKNLLHHLARPAVLLDHARRALAPGGRVVAVEVSRGSPWAWTFNLLAPRRERYFFVAGTARNRNAFTAAGLRVVAEDRFSLLPYELLFAIKYPVFRRLLPWTGATVDRVADVDQRLTRRAPALASYIIWVGEPAESSGGASMAGEGARGTSRA